MANQLPHVMNRCDGCEPSYRRGVHQAFVALRQYLETEGGDPLTVLQQFEEMAQEYRHDSKKHPALLHEISESLSQK